MGASSEGQHQAIIDNTTWENVQDLLAKNSQIAKNGLRAKHPSLLAGILFDDKGNSMSPSHAVKNKKRYRYYTSQALVKQQPEKAGSLPRIPATEIEALVIKMLSDYFGNPLKIIKELEDATQYTEAILLKAPLLNTKIKENNKSLGEFIKKVISSDKNVEIQLSAKGLCTALEIPDNSILRVLTIREKTQLKRCQGENKFIVGDVHNSPQQPNPSLLKAISRAWVWNEMFLNQEVGSIRELANVEGVTPRYIRKILTLIRTSPKEISQILDGKQNQNTTLKDLHIRTSLITDS